MGVFILVIYLTPFFPLSYKGEGEVLFFEGATPLQAILNEGGLWQGVVASGIIELQRGYRRESL